LGVQCVRQCRIPAEQKNNANDKYHA